MHLAQLNVARLAHRSTIRTSKPFTSALAAVNAVADEAPGFVWRLQEPRSATRRTSVRGATT